jgi:competence protein ComEA
VIFAFVLVALAIVGGAVLLLSVRPQPVRITINPPVPTPTPQPSATPAPIQVYVTGAVVQPNQIISLPVGSRVQDALNAVGGTTSAADLGRVNLAGILHDGDQVDVPSQGVVGSVPPTPSGGQIVHINTATLDELMTLPGVGQALAQRIIDYRTQNGPFANLEALDDVQGIGPAMLEKLKDLIAFD